MTGNFHDLHYEENRAGRDLHEARYVSCQCQQELCLVVRQISRA